MSVATVSCMEPVARIAIAHLHGCRWALCGPVGRPWSAWWRVCVAAMNAMRGLWRLFPPGSMHPPPQVPRRAPRGIGEPRQLPDAALRRSMVRLGLVVLAAAELASPPTTRGALPLAFMHGGPLGSGAELRPRGPRSATLEPLRGAAQDA